MTGKSLTRSTLRAFAIVATALPTALTALEPLPPCNGVFEGTMAISLPGPLGGFPDSGAALTSGVTVEGYYNRSVVAGDTYQDLQAPLAELVDFNGTRLVHCATGTFLAINRQSADDVAISVAATEFVRPRLQAGDAVSLSDLRRAANALYGDVIELQETEQTCGCAAFFDALKPAGQGPFHMRSDVDY